MMSVFVFVPRAPRHHPPALHTRAACTLASHYTHLTPLSCPIPSCTNSAGGKKGAKQQDDDGFQAAGKKKGGAKKGGKVDPSLLGFSSESSRIMQGEIQFVEGM